MAVSRITREAKANIHSPLEDRQGAQVRYSEDYNSATDEHYIHVWAFDRGQDLTFSGGGSYITLYSGP